MELSLRDRIRAGDQAAFAELFGAHARAVYSHAARLTGDRGAAEDVVSLTFLEAWRLREKLRPDAAPFEGFEGEAGSLDGEGLRPWLYGIATNVLRNTRRTARRHSAALARLPDRPADHDTVPDFADELVGRMEDAERLAAARTALGRLRRSEREVFALCVWSGLSYAAAGEALGVPASTVRSRLARARQRLRRLAEAELARRTSGGRAPGQRRTSGGRPPPEGRGVPFTGRPSESPGAPCAPGPPDVPPSPETPRLAPRTGQVPGGRPEAARSTQEKHR
ncbi:RNA polymerase sigma factor [Streptomyces violaceusniger]|uniref:RNA polymerase, sigma-24 subunit, ECF subfamily n=1 Tax=Streptomyces violaceusniger (strain Tu 4113) TaxID=653045 RepID=G2P753_STRV4|nr:RNA polymerase, sigma-24 subunit, ECF subfamily [Streptomyces violaceusniger Tu 4113]